MKVSQVEPDIRFAVKTLRARLMAARERSSQMEDIMSLLFSAKQPVWIAKLKVWILAFVLPLQFPGAANADETSRMGISPITEPAHFAPMYPSPPYGFNSSGMTIRFKTSPEVLKTLVPAPLVPNADGVMFLYIGHHKTTNLGDYNEAILGVPASLNGKVGSFAVVLYLDKAVPLVVGRERTGWHKKDAQIALIEEEGLLKARVERNGVVLIQATMRMEKPMNPESLAKSPPFFVLKVIPSANKDAAPEVMQLVSTASVNRKVKSGVAGRATLEFKGSPADPLNTIPITEILGAAHTVAEFDLAGGEILHDYLKQKLSVSAR